METKIKGCQNYYEGLLDSLELEIANWLIKNGWDKVMAVSWVSSGLVKEAVKPTLELYGINWKLDNQKD